MNIKLLVSIVFIGTCFLMSANDDDTASQVSDVSLASTIVEYEEKEVSFTNAMTHELVQMFTHDSHHYKGIEYGALYDNYRPNMLSILQDSLNQSELSEDEILNSMAYTVVGAEQFADEGVLFDRMIAKDNVIQLVKQFIDANEVAVRNKCVGVVLQENLSKVVWAPGCCDLQIHKYCFLQCRKKGITQCMNSFCTHPNWNKALYAQVVKNRYSVPLASLYDADCPLCMQPLKVDNYKKKRKINNDKKSLEIEVDGTTSSGKHTRFL